MNTPTFTSVWACVAAAMLLWVGGCDVSATGSTRDGSDQKETDMPPTVSVMLFNDAGELVGPFEVAKVVKTDEQWREQLTRDQYKILRASGTEPPGSCELLTVKEPGVFVCAGCRLPLFGVERKFESGTGWPSFYTPIAKQNIVEHVDRSYGMVRTEVVCARCDGHLGHVFDDGPPPTGLRYCINGDGLEFVPAAQMDTLAEAPRHETLVLAGGCFWCTEAVYEPVKGVVDVVSGYAGGSEDTANYRKVSTGATRHAEAVKITYDPKQVSLDELLRIFFTIAHDPTQLNRQGADVGPQYRSAVFYANDEQKQAAEAYIKKLDDEGHFSKPIVTTLEPLAGFYEAEDYHQDYAERNPSQPYIRAVAQPKVEKLREKVPAEKLKDK